MPGNSALTIPGRIGKKIKICSATPCLIDTAAVSNLPWGTSINHCLAHPKGNVVLVTVVNQSNHNVWLQQPLLVAEMFYVEHLPWDYGVVFHQEGQNIEVAFQPMPRAEIRASLQVVHDEPDSYDSDQH